MNDGAHKIEAVADKLARLIPRLATDADGEVVATARAIDRVLRSAGADWHDLSARLMARPIKPEPTRWTAGDELAVMANWLLRYALDDLSDNAADFVAAMTNQLPRRRPTKKQEQFLRTLYEEYFRQ